jgi:hypothetical protein
MTFNPGMMGLDPQQMAAARELGRLLKLEVRKCPREGRLVIRYIAVNAEEPGAQDAAANCVDNFAAQLAMMHDTLFDMKGKIIHED